jgi:hypothetical protein
MQDRPTAVELLRAAREFCERDLLPELKGRRQFHTRVLMNVLGILEREWQGEEQALRDEWKRLDALLGEAPEPATARELVASVHERNKQLAAGIRSGELDDRWDEMLTLLRETVRQKIEIANPRWAG